MGLVKRLPGQVRNALGPGRASRENGGSQERMSVRAVEESRKDPGKDRSLVVCAFCRGSGHDPFELLSKMSLCPVCGGKGKVEIVQPWRRCAFCGGTGAHPDTRLTCTVCMGRGRVTVVEPASDCPVCEGSGKAETGSNMPCSHCRGIGAVPRRSAT